MIRCRFLYMTVRIQEIMLVRTEFEIDIIERVEGGK